MGKLRTIFWVVVALLAALGAVVMLAPFFGRDLVKEAAEVDAAAVAVPSESAAPTPAPVPNSKLPAVIVAKDQTELVLIPAGSFNVGSDKKNEDNRLRSDSPAHEESLPDFYIGKTPVTNEQFLAYLQSKPGDPDAAKLVSYVKLQKPKSPVANLRFEMAEGYCAWASLRLPTELEWEKAARGSSGQLYPWGNQWDPKRVRFVSQYASPLAGTLSEPVGSRPENASPYGCLDMVEAVEQWTSSFLDPYPNTEWKNDFTGKRRLRVLRGLGIGDERMPPSSWEASRRSTDYMAAPIGAGIRCAMNAP